LLVGSSNPRWFSPMITHESIY